jgi:hypothetical protein
VNANLHDAVSASHSSNAAQQACLLFEQAETPINLTKPKRERRDLGDINLLLLRLAVDTRTVFRSKL